MQQCISNAAHNLFATLECFVPAHRVHFSFYFLSTALLMEVVLGTCVLSQVGMWVFDKTAKKRDEQASTGSGGAGSTGTTSISAAADAPAGSTAARIKELQEELASLKAAARDASGPDNFIQYARITRKQKKVEEELTALKGDEEPTLPILELMSSFMPQQNLASSAKYRALRGVLSMLPILLLWAWFRFGTSTDPSAIITADCDMFRPLSWMLTKIPAQSGCSIASDTCDARKVCAIGYRPVAIVANSVLARILSVLRKASS